MKIRNIIFVLLVLCLILPIVSATIPALSDYTGNRTFTYQLPASAGDQTGYQVKFILSNATGVSGYYAPDNLIYTNGSTRTDWLDVNATDGSGTPLKFWLENNTYTSKNATAWVKVPAISIANTSTGRWYFGNASQSMSTMDGLNTFEFWDDFLGDSLNATKWGTTSSPTVSVASGILSVSASSGASARDVYGISTFDKNYSLVSYEKTGHSGLSSSAYESVGWAPAGGPTYVGIYAYYSLNSPPYMNVVGGSKTSVTWDANIYYRTEIIRNSTTTITTIGSNKYLDSTSYSGALAPEYYVYNGGEAASVSSDWIFVRKSTTTEPVIILAGTIVTPPVASFTAVPTYGTFPLPVTFTDTSTNTPTNWGWSYTGYGTNTSSATNWSTSQNPVATFTNGNFSVVEKAGNAGGVGTSSVTWINVSAAIADPNPYSMIRYNAGSSNIEINNGTPYTGTVVSHNVTSNTTSVNGNFTWDTKWFSVSDLRVNSSSIAGTTLASSHIGNGYATFNVSKPTGMTPSANAILDFNITYTNYTSPGTLGTFSFDSTSKYYDPVNASFWNYNTIVGADARVGEWPSPTINFAANTTTPDLLATVQFTDSSSNFPTAWSWDFGDSTTSTLQNPTHIYTSIGTYSVTLHAYQYANATVTNTSTKTNYITILSPAGAPVAAFSGSPTDTIIGNPVSFTDASTNSPTSWAWSFGDSSSSTLQNPTHAYSSLGLYTVNLTVANLNGTSTLSRVSYINVTNTTPTVVTDADITMSPSFVLTLHVTDSSTGNAIPDVTLLDPNGNTYNTTTGTFTLSYGYGAVVLYLTSTGYISKSVSYVIDSDQTQTVQMTPSPTTPSQNTWWTPHTVQVTLMDDQYTNRLIGVTIDAMYNQSSMPTEWLNTLYGIQSNPATDMTNGSLTMTGVTGGDGTVTFTMLGSLKYDFYITSATYGLTNYHVSDFPSDSMINMYIPVASMVLPTNKNSTYTALNGTRVYYYEPDIYNVTMCVDYIDSTGLTTSVTDIWKFRDNNTVMHSVTFVPSTSVRTDCYTAPNARGVSTAWYYNATRSET